MKINPRWGKGYSRRGAALHGLRRYDEAIATYEKGLKLEDTPALRKGLQEVKDAKRSSAPENPFGGMFQDPDLIRRLNENPRTRPHLADPAFMTNVRPATAIDGWPDLLPLV